MIPAPTHPAASSTDTAAATRTDLPASAGPSEVRGASVGGGGGGFLTNDEMRALLEAAIKRAGSATAFARAIGAQQSNVSAMRSGRVRVHGVVARALGLRRAEGWVARKGFDNGGGFCDDKSQAGIRARTASAAPSQPREITSESEARAPMACAEGRSP